MKFFIRLVPLTSLFIMITACDVANDTSLKIAHEKKSAEALSVARQNGCLNCHNVTSSILGPAWVLVSKRYKNSADARDYLINKVKKGGSGAWNDITGGAIMPHIPMDSGSIALAGLNLIEQGFSIYDRDLKLVVCNRPVREMFELTWHLVEPGADFRKTIRYRAERG